MDVNIEELTSNVRTMDSQALLDPKVVEKLIAMVLKRVGETHDREKRAEDERQIRPGVSARNTPNWT
jgi:hypothetical protein